MNILKFELKCNVKAFVIWTVSLIIVYLGLMDGMYTMFSSSMEEVQKVYANFPPQFADAFGLNDSFLFSYGGFYSFTFNYIGLVAGIMAVSLGLSTFSREKRSKCMDFILAKPVNRNRIYFIKAISNIILLVVTNVIFVLIGLILYNRDGDAFTKMDKFFLALLAVFFTQLVFWTIGVFLGIFMKKIRSIAGLSTAIGFGAFILSALVNVLKEDWLNIIAPLKYFNPYPLLSEGKFKIGYIIAAVVVSGVCILCSFIYFCKSDTHVV